MKRGRFRAKAEKAALLLALLPRRPGEFLDRVAHFAGRYGSTSESPRIPYTTCEWSRLLGELGGDLGADLEAFTRESELAAFRAELEERRAGLEGRPFHQSHTGDIRLGVLCYALCRALRPRTVVETGVAYGLTSAFILQALDVNRGGALTSIDLPPLARDGDRHVGALIPDRLRGRWTLMRGTSRRLLPSALSRSGADLFVHDSLHTEKNMLAEFELAARHLRPPGVVLSDDVDHNSAWAKWTARQQPRFHRVVAESEKANQIGVAVLASAEGRRTSR